MRCGLIGMMQKPSNSVSGTVHHVHVPEKQNKFARMWRASSLALWRSQGRLLWNCSAKINCKLALLHWNVTASVGKCVMETKWKVELSWLLIIRTVHLLGVTGVPQIPCLPYLAPSNFFCFSKLKMLLKRKRISDTTMINDTIMISDTTMISDTIMIHAKLWEVCAEFQALNCMIWLAWVCYQWVECMKREGKTLKGTTFYARTIRSRRILTALHDSNTLRTDCTTWQ